MLTKKKKVIAVLCIWLGLFLVVELSCFVFLKIYYNKRIKNSEYPRLFQDIQLYLDRFHPLFANNDDLYARNPDLDFDSIVGYKFAPNTIHVRPYSDYTSYIEIDSQGFVHNGDPARNKAYLNQNPKKLYRIVFLGGSTTAGRGASRNEYTIPAYFERFLEKQWGSVDFQVINAANWGYSTTEERLYYSFYIKPIKPDLIIFIDGDNDVMLYGIQKEWTPYFHDMKFSDGQHRGMFRPKTAFSNFIQSLKRFPQPLYSLFFIDKFLYKIKLIKAKSNTPKKKVDFVFHQEGMNQSRSNLLATTREISFEKSRAIFFLQPIINIKKNVISENEKKYLQIMETSYPHYQENMEKYFEEFSKIYQELQKRFIDNPSINFVDISDIFKENANEVYVNAWHCNDYGYKIIAERIFDEAKESIKKDLIKKGLIK